MKSIAQIAAELQGYDPQALSADQVSAFLERLALPVTATEELGIFEASHIPKTFMPPPPNQQFISTVFQSIVCHFSLFKTHLYLLFPRSPA